jgi:hypothetical protein
VILDPKGAEVKTVSYLAVYESGRGIERPTMKRTDFVLPRHLAGSADLRTFPLAQHCGSLVWLVLEV